MKPGFDSGTLLLGKRKVHPADRHCRFPLTMMQISIFKSLNDESKPRVLGRRVRVSECRQVPPSRQLQPLQKEGKRGSRRLARDEGEVEGRVAGERR